MDSFEFLGGRYNRPEQIMSGPMQAFRAQNAATGRVVFIHRVSTTEAPQEQASLLKLLTTALVKSDEAKRLVLDFGEERGYWYVVTESEPQCALLREWLQLQIDAALANSGKPAGRQGAQAQTPSTPQATPTPSTPIVPPRGPEDSGEFTRFLQKTRSPLVPPPTASRIEPPPSARVSPTPVPPAAPHSPTSSSSPAPEFTKAFRSEETATDVKPQSSAEPSQERAVPPPVQRPPAGEFTQMFSRLGGEPKESQTPAEPAAVVPPVAPVGQQTQPAAGTGEFTRFFSGGLPASTPKSPNPYVQRPTKTVPPGPVTSPPATAGNSTPPGSATPGEFTQFFSGATHGSGQPAPAPPVQRPASRVPPPASASPATPGEGEFTRMFAKSPEAGRQAPLSNPLRHAEEAFGGANQDSGGIFGRDQINIPQPLPAPSQQAGEFTQLFGAGNSPPAVQRPSVVAAPKAVSPVNDQPFGAPVPPVAAGTPPSQQEEPGPSEFTRIMRGGASAGPAAASPPVAEAPPATPMPNVPLPKVSVTPPNAGGAASHLAGAGGAAQGTAGPSGASASGTSMFGSANVSAAVPPLPKPAVPAAKLPVPTPAVATSGGANRKMIILFAVLGVLALVLILLTLFLMKK